LGAAADVAKEENASAFCWVNYPQASAARDEVVAQNIPPMCRRLAVGADGAEARTFARRKQFLVAETRQIGLAKVRFFPQIALTGAWRRRFWQRSAFSGLMSSQIGIWSRRAREAADLNWGSTEGKFATAESPA